MSPDVTLCRDPSWIILITAMKLYSVSMLPAEWLYQKNHDRFCLLDDHVCYGVNLFATTHEIVREWRSMDKLVKEQKLHVERQKEWTSACERSKCDPEAACDEVVKVKGERDAESREVQCLSALAKEKEIQAIEAQKSHAEALA
ncbi:hypothetical protein Hanom_Chr17g01525351 [Helianthus anomalus]